MRQGPHSKRGRGRGNNRRPNVPNRNQTFDSNGPDVRIRGNAHQVYEKYLTLARDASTAGDRVLAESLFQHADHYFRIYSMFNEENEARRAAAAQQDNAAQPDVQSRDDDGDGNSDAQGGSDNQRPQSDDEQAGPRRTRSERRQDAEAAEQGDQPDRPARPPRRRRNGNGASGNSVSEGGAGKTDNDAALRAMLGAGEAGLPKASGGESAGAGEQAEEAKPVRRRGRPRKAAPPEEQALPPAGED